MARSSSNTMLWLLLAVFASLAAAGAGRGDDGRRSSPQVYVVYMGAVPPRTSPDLLLESHLRLLGTVLKRSSSSQSSSLSIYICTCSPLSPVDLSRHQAALVDRTAIEHLLVSLASPHICTRHSNTRLVDYTS